MLRHPSTLFRLKLVLCGLLAASLLQAESSSLRHFVFGSDPEKAGETRVASDLIYSAEHGYGFENGQAPRNDLPVKGPICTSEKPFLFSVALPEGNYRVTVTLGDPAGASNTTIKAETRRLMVRSLSTEKGALVRSSFIVNIRTPKLTPPPKNAPGGTQVDINERELNVLHWDNKLTLEFLGSRPCVDSIEIEPAPGLPTVFLAGDSTVTDQPGEPGASWGQMLPYFFKDTIAVANHAESGETLKSFLTAHRLDKILEQAKPGDFLFVQFGHNDSKTQWPQTYAEAKTTYKAYLAVFVAEARRRGIQPVLVTSMHRRRFDAAGKIINTHGDYPAAVRETARELKVPLVDLNAISATLFEALGNDPSALAFTDITHFTNYGAFELASCVVESIRKDVPELAKHLKTDLPAFDPAKPDDPKTWRLPASAARMTAPPRGN